MGASKDSNGQSVGGDLESLGFGEQKKSEFKDSIQVHMAQIWIIYYVRINLKFTGLIYQQEAREAVWQIVAVNNQLAMGRSRGNGQKQATKTGLLCRSTNLK